MAFPFRPDTGFTIGCQSERPQPRPAHHSCAKKRGSRPMDVSAARRFRVAVGAVTAVAALLCSQPRVAAQGEWWQPLKYRTAWVLLGVVSNDGREWTTEPLHVS